MHSASLPWYIASFLHRVQLDEAELACKLREAEDQLRAVLPGEWQVEVATPTDDTQVEERETQPSGEEEEKEEDVPSALGDHQESPLDREKEEDENAKRVAQLTLVVKYFKVSLIETIGIHSRQ